MHEEQRHTRRTSTGAASKSMREEQQARARTRHSKCTEYL